MNQSRKKIKKSNRSKRKPPSLIKLSRGFLFSRGRKEIVAEAATVSEARINEDEEGRSKAGRWADLHADIVAEIFRRLDVVSYIRSRSACASWRSISEKTNNFCKPSQGRQLPWLLLVSSSSDDPRSRRFYGASCFHTKMAEYTMHLPHIAHHDCIGSSRGFLIAVDSSSARLCALNPLTGARFPIPPAATLPDTLLYDEHRPDAPPRLIIPDDHTRVTLRYRKAVISPPLDTIAVATVAEVTSEEETGILRYVCNLAFARAGDDSWTALMPPSAWIYWNKAEDLIFHKGRLYVIYFNGYLAVFDLENPAAPPLVSPGMVPKDRGLYLTETPDGENLLLLSVNSTDMGVFRLDQNTLEWNQVQSIGHVALFLGRFHLFSLSTREFPCLESNCIYLTADVNWPIYWPIIWPRKTVNHIGVYDLKHGSIHRSSPRGGFWPSLVWFTPAL